MTPALSVIVTAYNIERYIGRALASVLEQDFADLEIIVVDDGSTDGTLAVAERTLQGRAHVHLIAQANAGPGGARNTGIAKASGTYIAFLDGDDWYAPDAFRRLYAEVAHEPADIVLGKRRLYWEKTDKTEAVARPSWPHYRGPVAMAELLHIVSIHGKLFRRAFLQDNAIAFPEGMSSEDFVFTYRAYAAAETVVTIPEQTYFQRRRASGDSLSQDRLSPFALESRFRQIEMTQDIVAHSDLRRRFPAMDFARKDYDERLMRHVMALSQKKNAKVRAPALAALRDFIARHQNEIFACVTPETKTIYEALLAGDAATVLELCRARRAAAVQNP